MMHCSSQKVKSLNFLALTIKIKYFRYFFRYAKISRSKITSKKNFFFKKAFGMPKSVQVHGDILVWALLDNEQDL